MKRIVLGLDQGAHTGWGIAPERGRVVRHGLARTVEERKAVVALALEYAGGDPAWLWVMFERHDHMPLTRLTNHDHETRRRGRQAAPERTTESLIGMGKNYGVWIGMLDMLGVPRSHLLEVTPTTWRLRVHGVTKGELVKQAAIDWASLAAGEPITDDNHAEGYCITTWAALDGFARYDAERAQSRVQARAKRAAAKQGDLFGGCK